MMLRSKLGDGANAAESKVPLKEKGAEIVRERPEGLEAFALAGEESEIREVAVVKAVSQQELVAFVRSLVGENTSACLQSKDADERFRFFQEGVSSADGQKLLIQFRAGRELLERCDVDRLERSGVRYALQDFAARAEVAQAAAKSLEVLCNAAQEVYVKPPEQIAKVFAADVIGRVKNIPVERLEVITDLLDRARLSMIIALGPYLRDEDLAAAVVDTSVKDQPANPKKELEEPKPNAVEPEEDDLEARLAAKRAKLYGGARPKEEAEKEDGEEGAEVGGEAPKTDDSPSEQKLIEQSEVKDRTERISDSRQRALALKAHYGAMKNLSLPTDAEEKGRWRKALVKLSEVDAFVDDAKLLNRFRTLKINGAADSAVHWIKEELRLINLSEAKVAIENIKLTPQESKARAEKCAEDLKGLQRVYGVYAFVIKLGLKAIGGAIDAMEQSSGIALETSDEERHLMEVLLERRAQNEIKVIVPAQGVSNEILAKERAARRAREEEVRQERADPWGRIRKKNEGRSTFL